MGNAARQEDAGKLKVSRGTAGNVLVCSLETPLYILLCAVLIKPDFLESHLGI